LDAPDSEFRKLVEQYRAGDPEALTQLYARYGGVVRAAVRRRLPDGLRKEYDSTDFAQDVWASFFTRPPAHARFESPAALGGYLAAVARNKVAEACRRRYQSAGRDIAREQPLAYAADGADLPVAGREATPSQCAIADEQYDAISGRLPAAHRRVVDLLRAGHTQVEIAAKLTMSERHVRRIVERLRELCEDAP
jgi:RNA polymerase sigma factor (sigma-70 family)